MAPRSELSLDNLPLVGKIFIGVLLVSLVAVAYFVVFYSEVSTQIEAQENSLVQKQQALAQAERTREEYNRDLAEKNQREQSLPKFKKHLPDEAETPAFLSSVQTVAAVSGIRITSWTPLQEEPVDFYSKVPMELKLEGRFHQMSKFFSGFGAIDRIINMENIEIKIDRPNKKLEDIDPDAASVVKVECLATAYRTLGRGEKAGKGGGTKRNRRKGGRR